MDTLELLVKLALTIAWRTTVSVFSAFKMLLYPHVINKDLTSGANEGVVDCIHDKAETVEHVRGNGVCSNMS